MAIKKLNQPTGPVVDERGYFTLQWAKYFQQMIELNQILIETILGEKASKISGGTAGNLTKIKDDGDLEDAGVTPSSVVFNFTQVESVDNASDFTDVSTDDYIPSAFYQKSEHVAAWTEHLSNHENLNDTINDILTNLKEANLMKT